jgi:plasmid maintenance system antidote protein VapI
MYFELLQFRLITHLQQRVQSGELTERSLARHTGISQPHLHNMLKGIRVLSPPMADLLLRHLHMTLLDLLNVDELAICRRTGQLG